MGDYLFFTLQALSHRRFFASFSLFCRYLHGKCSNDLPSIVPSTIILTAKTRYPTYNEAKYPIHIPLVVRKFHTKRLISRSGNLRKCHPIRCFPITPILNYSCIKLIYLTYPHKLLLLPLIQHIFISCLLLAALELCTS